ncbi:MAG: hypothetical protein H6839_15265 [Planctomycetes bacterium]|nr:hypothetical protein [Planctomycetota bacterium]
MKRLLPALLLLFAAGCSKPQPHQNNQPACNPPGQTSNEANEPVPETPEPEPGPKTLGVLEAADSPDQVRAVELIEKVTGLKFTQAIPVYNYTPEELAEELRGWGDDGFTPENILGFYKPSTKCLYMVPDAAGEKRQFGLRIHEATHGLQDQHYDLAVLHGKPTTTDQEMALIALIEGEASQVMIDALIDEQPQVAYMTMYGVLDVLKLPSNPKKPLTEERLRKIFLYSDGARFVKKLADADSYAAVDAAFKDLPLTSEQILHFEKYSGQREAGDTIELDLTAVQAALPEGWKLGEADTAGEIGTIVELALHGDPATAGEAAEGWGGDVMLTATKGDQKLSLWVTTWDTPEDAKQFWEALLDLKDLSQAEWDEPGAPRKVIAVRGDGDASPTELAAIIDALAEAKVTYHDE